MKKLENPTVLLVDDETEILRALKRRYRKESFTLLTASSGEEAVELLKKRKVHVLLSDARMPGMNGIQLLKQVKEMYPETIRIMISGYIETENLIAAINTGEVFRFVSKPWEEDRLREVIHEAIGNYEALQHNREDMSRILKHNENRSRENIREHDLFITNALVEEYGFPVICIDREFNILCFNSRANRLFEGKLRDTEDISLSQLLPEETIEKLQDDIGGGMKQLSFTTLVSGQKLPLRVRPLRKSDTPAAILFFDEQNA